MAEFFVFDIAESLLGKLASYVHEEVSGAYDVYEDLQGIKDTLSIVKGVLLDAEEKKEQKHGLREWLRQIQNMCLDAEDVLDGFECQILRNQVVKASGSTRVKVGHFFSWSNSLVFRLRMARQIKHVRHRLNKIAADGNKFGLERIDVDHRLVQRREMTYSHVDASGVIGRENDVEEIINLLTQPHSGGDGDNKTPTSALVHQENINNLDIEQLQSRLRQVLSDQKYLLVLDDIWNDDRPKWIELKDLIKVGGMGSKILATTRSNSIASMMGTVPSSRSVRTILFPIHGIGVGNEALLDAWITRYKYLRLLDLSDSSFETLPNSIAKLELLRALKLENNCRIKRLPHSLCKLQNLLFLSLRGCVQLETLTKGLGMLISLQHLHITTKQSILSEEDFAGLSNVHTLSFEYCDNLKFLFRRAQLPSLEVLHVQSCGSLESLPLHILPKLEALLVRQCGMLNLSLNYESAIQRLRMKFLHLEHCPRQQTLPQWILGAADTLQTLLIINFHSLKMLPEWLTTMTHLKMLHIVNCPLLLCLPSDMHCLTALEDLSIDGCPELCKKCEPQSGEFWSFIAHIKHLSIGETREGHLLFRMLSRLRLDLRG
ncbi:Disease resistance protein RGA2 [Glycine soja]|nr:Disease resistance protein RGA2 [Glycine soja]